MTLGPDLLEITSHYFPEISVVPVFPGPLEQGAQMVWIDLRA